MTDAEKTRNHVIRIAAGGQEAVDSNNAGVSEVQERYAKKAEEEKEAKQS